MSVSVSQHGFVSCLHFLLKETRLLTSNYLPAYFMDAEGKDTFDLLSMMQTGLIENHMNVFSGLSFCPPPTPRKSLKKENNIQVLKTGFIFLLNHLSIIPG